MTCGENVRWKITRTFTAIPPTKTVFACWEHLSHVCDWMMSLPLGDSHLQVGRGDWAVKPGINCAYEEWLKIRGQTE
ncbi:MAG: hypothetical protein GTN93_21460 [Anaerolineae bacterium]|nr:hypothetical protein [Anaerolineae bacterium]